MTPPIRLIASALSAALLSGTAVTAQQASDPMPLSAPQHPDVSERATSTLSPHGEWGYSGSLGPSHWAELSENYAICSRGQQESPIDLRGALSADLGKLGINWHPVPLRVANNGHTIQVDTPAGSSLRLRDKTYALLQFHIHHPSEHLLNGRRFPLEIHFVHRAADGVVGVLGVFVEEGRSNPALQAVLDNMPTEVGTTHAVAGAMLDLHGFLPTSDTYYRYEGSLTTPPCSENVDWAILDSPIHASLKQIKAFEKLYPMNARPLQALNRRFLLRNQ